MAMSFELLLVILTLVSGALALVDIIWLEKKRTAAVAPAIFENARGLFPVLLIVLLLRSFVVEPFRIPSGSLEPSLMPGDFIAASKFSYGLRLPVTHQKILAMSEPKVGDIAVFRWPVDPHIDFIKRVIGVPGDTISYQNKVLYINGIKQAQQYVGPGIDEETSNQNIPVQIYRETLNGVVHQIFINPEAPTQDFTLTVPAGEYFMMGDNRDDSYDSRGWGFVPEKNLIGKALAIWFSWAGSSHGWVHWARIGTIIHSAK